MTAMHATSRARFLDGVSATLGRTRMGLVGGALTLFACITLPMEWKKDGVKSDQVKYDKAVCEYNAEIQAGPVGSLSSEQRAARKDQVKKMTNLCMTSRGYKLEQVPIDP
jgi:hypothetical protein